jgi:hypothetical protein
MTMMQPAQARELTLAALERAGVDYPMASARRVFYNGRDAALQGCIEVRGYAAASTEPLDRIEAAMRTLPNVLRVRVIRGPQNWIGREKDLRPQVIAWLKD